MLGIFVNKKNELSKLFSLSLALVLHTVIDVDLACAASVSRQTLALVAVNKISANSIMVADHILALVNVLLTMEATVACWSFVLTL